MRDRIRKLEAAIRQQDHAPDDPAALAVALIYAGVQAEHSPGTPAERQNRLQQRVVELCERHSAAGGRQCG